MPKKSPAMRQQALFELRSHREQPVERVLRKVPIERKLVLEALRDIHRLSSESHIQKIAENVLFFHGA